MSSGSPSRLVQFLLLRPTFAILLTAAFIAAGLMGYGSLVKEATPDLEIPQATVVVEWPGADPESVAAIEGTLEDERFHARFCIVQHVEVFLYVGARCDRTVAGEKLRLVVRHVDQPETA